MCAISGIFNLNSIKISNLRRKLIALNEIQIHRGPDSNDIWIDENEFIGLAHSRLSIIDLSISANQPMVSNSGNILVYNGEIYNYLELKKKLKNFFDFKTHSDTEVLLAAYEKYGLDFVNYLDGMFAFALWDSKEKNLICARDRYGIKPFYYSIIDDNFFFSSEAKALVFFQKQLRINDHKLFEYLVYQYNTFDETLFNNIFQINPGEKLIVNSFIKKTKYWDYENSIKSKRKLNNDELKNKFHNAIEKNLVSDVDVGTHLSGGIDSSMITILAKKSNNFKAAFHGYFNNKDAESELEYAEYIARKKQIKLKKISITNNDVINSIEKIIFSLDYPVAGPGSIPQFLVSKEISSSVKVVLGGQGADELFAGYIRYLLFYIEYLVNLEFGLGKKKKDDWDLKKLLPNLVYLKNYKSLIKSHLSNGLFGLPESRYYSLIKRSQNIDQMFDFPDSFHKNNISNFYTNLNAINAKTIYEKIMIYDFKFFLPSLLHVEDRVSMAHGLETRVPFLDNEFVDYISTIKRNEKYVNCRPKSLIINIAKKILPKKISSRTNKMGFPVPLKQIIINNKDFFYDLINTSINKKRPFLNTNFFKKRQFLTLPTREIWGLISLELWYQQYFDKFNQLKKIF